MGLIIALAVGIIAVTAANIGVIAFIKDLLAGKFNLGPFFKKSIKMKSGIASGLNQIKELKKLKHLVQDVSFKEALTALPSDKQQAIVKNQQTLKIFYKLYEIQKRHEEISTLLATLKRDLPSNEPPDSARNKAIIAEQSKLNKIHTEMSALNKQLEDTMNAIKYQSFAVMYDKT